MRIPFPHARFAILDRNPALVIRVRFDWPRTAEATLMGRKVAMERWLWSPFAGKDSASDAQMAQASGSSTALFGRLRVTARSFRDRRLDGSVPTTQVHYRCDGPGL